MIDKHPIRPERLRQVPVITSYSIHYTKLYEGVLAESVAENDEIVVTATRTDRKVLQVPAAVSVVAEERLADLPLMGGKEALNGLAGVQAETIV